jgi:hypothetical protein
MEHIIQGLIIGAESKFNITATVTGNTLGYIEQGRSDVTAFHYKDAESLLLGLISLYDTGHASLPVIK